VDAKTELNMIDRHFLRDVAIAVLLGVPTAALSRPEPPQIDHSTHSAAVAEQAALADQSSTERRFNIDG
jgi:hypothetical protein